LCKQGFAETKLFTFFQQLRQCMSALWANLLIAKEFADGGHQWAVKANAVEACLGGQLN
jgi:hypothetical protein